MKKKNMINLRFQSKAPAKIKNSSFPLILFSTLSMHTYPQTSHYLAPTFLYLTLPIHTHLDGDFNVPHLHLTTSNLHLTVPYLHLSLLDLPNEHLNTDFTTPYLHLTLFGPSKRTLKCTHISPYILYPYPYSNLPSPNAHSLSLIITLF